MSGSSQDHHERHEHSHGDASSNREDLSAPSGGACTSTDSAFPSAPSAGVDNPGYNEPNRGLNESQGIAMNSSFSTENDPSPMSDKLHIVVQDQLGGALAFILKTTTPLGKVMDSFCNEKKLSSADVARSSIRFLFDGRIIHETDTAQKLALQDGDTINVYAFQTGGGAGNGGSARL